MNKFIKYCLLNEIDERRINLPKSIDTCQLSNNEAQYWINSGKLFRQRDGGELDNIRLNFFEGFTQQVLNHFQLKDLNFKFIVNLNDGPHHDEFETRFFFARPKNSPHICIPDSHLPRVNSVLRTLNEIDIPLENKINKISFFGSDTGKRYENGICQRTKLCKMYTGDENIIAKITNFVDGRYDDSITHPYISIKDQLKYKYILNVNGNTTSWERLIWALASNSICIFLKPPVQQDEISWYYHIFDIFRPFIFLDEFSVENFMLGSDSFNEFLINLKKDQKILGESLASPNFHAVYYSNVLMNYNKIYNEQNK